MKYPIGVGSTVTLHLRLSLEDGTVAEETFSGEPHTFRMGDGSLLHGLELGLYGLKPGDTQRLELYPEQAYGLRDPANIRRLPRERFADDMEPEPGMIIGFETPDGEEIPGSILSVSDDSVEVDFNHPLAGHTITFDVEIVDVLPAEPGEE
ncbi:MAG: FKBP-type peptidyl-prolyl cis-trans isomerase [Gammaproteobacteria bacterium]|nr:MAG: FKBP-type peptidyl-prolyl cis-trans isomerase [Gammaproteobacteria bacterium]